MAQIFEWIKTNADVISAVSSVATIVVWLAYFQLIYSRYAHERRPRIYIQQNQGYGLDSTCQLLNMSQRYIDIMCVILVAHTSNGSFSQPLTDYPRISQDTTSPDSKHQTSQQGALFPGHSIPLGTIGDLLEEVSKAVPDEVRRQVEERGQDPAEGVEALEVRVVAMFGEEDLPIGTHRQFTIGLMDNAIRVHPKTMYTTQLTSRSERRKAEKWFEECLEA